MELTIYFVIAVISVLLYFLKPRARKGRVIPGPPGWPLLGSALDISEQTMPQKCSEYADTYGDIVQVNIFGTNIVLLNSVEVIQKAVFEDPYKQYFNDRPTTFYGEHFLFNNKGVIVMPDAFNSPHSELRKHLVKSLHVYGEGIAAFEEKVQKELENVLTRIAGFGDREFPFQEQLRLSFTNLLSILRRCLIQLSGEALPETHPDVELFWELDAALIFMYSPKADLVYRKIPFARHLPGQYRDQYMAAMNARARILDRYFKKHKAGHSPGKVRGLIDLLLEEQTKERASGGAVVLTDECLQALILEMIAAALVTTLCSESAIMLCLVNHPEWQTRIHTELDAVVGRGRRPRLEDRERCPVLEAVVLETQRLITVIPLCGPHYCKENISFEGYDIPAGSMVLPNLEYVHHRKSVWGEDAWDFRPDRFLDEHGELLPRTHPYRKNWIPFGLGRRQCLGDTFARSRLFLYTATLLQRWSFRPSTHPDRFFPCSPRKDGQFEINLATRPKEFYCQAVPRS